MASSSIDHKLDTPRDVHFCILALFFRANSGRLLNQENFFFPMFLNETFAEDVTSFGRDFAPH